MNDGFIFFIVLGGAEITMDTTNINIEDSTNIIIDFLKKDGLIND